MADSRERLFDRLLKQIAELHAASLALQREIEAELADGEDRSPTPE